MAVILNLFLMQYYASNILEHVTSPAIKIEVLATQGGPFDGANVSMTMRVHRLEETENQTVMYFFGDAGESVKTVAPKGLAGVRQGQLISVLGVWDDNQKAVHAEEIYVHEQNPIVPFYVSIPALPILLILLLGDWRFNLKKFSVERRTADA